MNITIAAEHIAETNLGNGYMGVEVNFKWNHARRSANSYRMTFSPEGIGHRKDFGGPLVEERFGSISPEATIIALHTIADPRPVIELNVGDIVELEGHGKWLVGEPTRWNYDRPTVTPID